MKIIFTTLCVLLNAGCSSLLCSNQTGFPLNTAVSLFDGAQLGQWSPTDFAHPGPISIEDSCILIGMGGYLSGITWNGPLLRMNYEIELDAKRIAGNDFFCGLTFPYGESYCSLIVGGWSNTIIGLSNVNGADASGNETSNWMPLHDNHWYHIRLRVTSRQIQAWINEKQMVDLDTHGKTIDIRMDIRKSLPLGIATYWTTAAIKNVTLKRLNSEEL